jgi:hypothetical protein
MAGTVNRTQDTVGFIIRFLVSLILPAWGIALIVLGAEYGLGWWIASGVAIGAAGVVIFVGSPLVRVGVREG